VGGCDLDLDGLVDFAAADGSSAQLVIMRAPGRSFAQLTLFNTEEMGFGSTVTCGDVDGDARAEVLVITPLDMLGTSQLHWFHSRDPGSGMITHTVESGPPNLGYAVIGDVSAGAGDEWIVTQRMEGALPPNQILLVDDFRVGMRPFALEHPASEGTLFPSAIAIAQDVDGDGLSDILVGNALAGGLLYPGDAGGMPALGPSFDARTYGFDELGYTLQ